MPDGPFVPDTTDINGEGDYYRRMDEALRYVDPIRQVAGKISYPPDARQSDRVVEQKTSEWPWYKRAALGLELAGGEIGNGISWGISKARQALGYPMTSQWNPNRYERGNFTPTLAGFGNLLGDYDEGPRPPEMGKPAEDILPLPRGEKFGPDLAFYEPHHQSGPYQPESDRANPMWPNAGWNPRKRDRQ